MLRSVPLGFTWRKNRKWLFHDGSGFAFPGRNAFQGKGKGKAANAIFQRGKSLKRYRQKADYDHAVDSLSTDVLVALKDAETIFHWLDNLP